MTPTWVKYDTTRVKYELNITRGMPEPLSPTGSALARPKVKSTLNSGAEICHDILPLRSMIAFYAIYAYENLSGVCKDQKYFHKINFP